EVGNAKDFQNFLRELDVKGRIFVVKPDWSTASSFTSAETLDWLFSSMEGVFKVVEGYSDRRNQLNTGIEAKEVFTTSNVKAKWEWIKEQETWFLRFSGIDETLRRHNVEYINTTEEIWSTRTLESEEVKERVDNKYGTLISQEMYRMVPTKIHELRDSTLISLGNCDRSQEQLSFSTVNLLGLIADPVQYRKSLERGNDYLAQKTVDINKIYRSFFSPCYWINEIKNNGIFVGSRNSAEADAVTAHMLGLDPEKIPYLRHVTNVFGGYDRAVLDKIAKIPFST
ncbi:MAG: hypothetical protein JSV64_01180, partial [Candidatus Bathyarchaeota archaeon]